MSTLPRKTRQAWDQPGHAHFLTFSCYQRFPLLSKDRTRQWVIEAMLEAQSALDLALWAYVIMPEHVHILLRPKRPDCRVRDILTTLKEPVSRNAKCWLTETNNSRWIEKLTVGHPSRERFRFWQPGGGYDQNIFKEKTVWTVMEYIHANPVRRGLVTTPTEWAWSSARFWEGCKDVPVRMDRLDE